MVSLGSMAASPPAPKPETPLTTIYAARLCRSLQLKRYLSGVSDCKKRKKLRTHGFGSNRMQAC